MTLGDWPKKTLVGFLWAVLPMFSSKSFMVSCLIFKSLSHFEFIFVYDVRECSNFFDLHEDVQLSQHDLLKRLPFFPLYSLAEGQALAQQGHASFSWTLGVLRNLHSGPMWGGWSVWFRLLSCLGRTGISSRGLYWCPGPWGEASTWPQTPGQQETKLEGDTFLGPSDL